ncbi:MAG: hypothetical protein HY323_03505 [Betaproteobacteria bacterium]|nr:hypothetical protein [Betaproteobacteria bacterium]MBI3936018.1 hypothetical protein [Betaproteobacteria bacterium]
MRPGLSVLLIAVLAALPAYVQADGRDRGFHRGQFHMQNRIHQGWRAGDLTRGEVRGLEREARHLRRDERAFAADGRISPWERRQLHRERGQLSRDIFRERHDGERRFSGRFDGRAGFGHRSDERFGGRGAGWGRGFDGWRDRSRDSIVRGVRSGALTPDEARGLRAEQRALRQQERLYRGDGALTPEERADLRARRNTLREHIYNETHDAERR